MTDKEKAEIKRIVEELQKAGSLHFSLRLHDAIFDLKMLGGLIEPLPELVSTNWQLGQPDPNCPHKKVIIGKHGGECAKCHGWV